MLEELLPTHTLHPTTGEQVLEESTSLQEEVITFFP